MTADIIVVLIIAFSAYIGYKKGFVRAISKLCCFIVAIIAAKLLHPRVTELVSNSVVGETIRKKVAESYSGYVGGNIPSFMQSIGDQTANGISELAVSVVSVIAIIIITYFVAKLAAASLNLFAKMPVVSLFNRVIGFAIGALAGLLIAYAVVSLVILADVQGVEKWMEGSVIAYKMYHENFILNLIF